MTTRSHAWLLTAALLAAPTALHATAPDAKVTAVTLSHSAGTARLAIALDGAVEVRDYTLAEPARLVIDLKGATLEQVAGAYDGLKRGSVRDVRVRQYEVDVVRVVLEFDRLPAYRVQADVPGVVTVAFADEAFGNWRLGGAPVATPGIAAVGESEAAPAPARAARQEMPVYAGRSEARPTALGSQAQDEPRVNVLFDETPMRDVIATFAAYSGQDMVVGPGAGEIVVQGASFTNKPWSQAFHALLATYGLSVAQMPGGILRIDSPGELAKLDSVEVLEHRVIRLNYAKASEMAVTVQNLVTPNRGAVQPDSTLNALVITETRTKMQSLIEFVQGMDIKTPTVAIQAKLIFVDRTDLSQLGLKYDIGTSDQFLNKIIQRIDPLTGQPYNPNVNIVNLSGSSVAAISNADALISGSALDLIFTTAIGGFSVSAFLSALERVELTDVEAVPIIHTLDNQRAYILSGEETPVRVIDASSFGQVNQAPRANVQFKETGIRLTVTPSVTANREIRMQVEVERSSIQPLAAADLGFTIPKQIASSRLLVADGETAVIGGLTTTTVTRNRSGIPLLSSLPFVGSLFSFTENNENRKDLIVLVQPRIIDDPM
ncbi:MAG: AMIN domain-containing protein [Gemmatimonadetes bacterium]|nr:AMIN domain-containing protein [Gemmatimonadota bacterium]